MTDIPLVGPASAPDLAVMTYNIRRRLPRLASSRADRWSTRAPLLGRLLVAERPTVIGLQEAFADQTAFVTASLGPDYRSLGGGRDAGGGGEGCPIAYDSSRLEVLDWRQSALSNTPTVPGSRVRGAAFPRVVVEARFRDLATGQTLRVVNTHLDPFSAAARLRSAQLITALLSTVVEPTLLTCDANAPTGSPAYRELTGRGGLADAWHAADQLLTPEWNTYAGYRAPRAGGRRIDWLLVGGGVRVLRAGVNASRSDGRAASDHEPVQALLRLPAVAV